jgi:hypothetical protein
MERTVAHYVVEKHRTMANRTDHRDLIILVPTPGQRSMVGTNQLHDAANVT